MFSKMRFKFASILAVGLLLQINYLRAQETLTLQEAITYALEHKAEAKTAKLDIENAQYQIDEVRAGALPQVNASGTLRYNILIPEMVIDMDGQVITAKMGLPWNSTAAVSLNQQLFNQSLFTGLKAARTTREFYQLNAQLTDEQLIENVSNAYYDIFQTQLQLQTIQNNLDNTSKTHKIIDGMVGAGLAKKIDLDRLSVAVNNLESQKQQIQSALQLKENALKFAIGMPMERGIVLPEETFEINPAISLQTNDIENRSEILLSEKQIELYELNKKAQKASLYPTLSLGTDFGFNGFGQGFPIGGDFMWPKTSSIGLNLSIPIFTGGATRARINQADIDIRKARTALEDRKLGISLANENAKTQIRNSLLTVDANRRNVTLAREVLSDTQNNYNNGLATLTDLLDAEKALADAETNLNTSLLDYKLAEIQLIKANGNLKSLVNE